MFYPGETDTHVFDLPFAAEDISKAIVSYKQRGRLILEKTASAFDVIESHLCRFSVLLTQEESMKFFDNIPINIQVNL